MEAPAGKVVIINSQNRIMKEEREVFEKYRIESEIGRGASGVCYRVQHNKTKELYAMKKIHISSIKVQYSSPRNKTLEKPAQK